MTADEYEAQRQALKRGSSLDDYRDQILYWLRAYPTRSTAQVCDWLTKFFQRLQTNLRIKLDATTAVDDFFVPEAYYCANRMSA